MGMDEPNPYEPPRSGQTKSRRMGSVIWIIILFVFENLFCASFMGGDPFNSVIIIGFGAVCFFLGIMFAREREKGIIQHQVGSSDNN